MGDTNDTGEEPPASPTSPAPAFLLTSLRLFTGTGVIEDGWIFIKPPFIHSLGSMPPPGYLTEQQESPLLTLSLPNHTLLPGLIDAHIHANNADPLALPNALLFGLTTVCDMHNESDHVLVLRRQAATNPATCASLKTCGLAATVADGWPAPVVTALDDSAETRALLATWPNLQSPSDVERFLDAKVAEHADYVKLMHESGAALGLGRDLVRPPLTLQRSLIEGARARGLPAVVHVLSREDAREMVELGVDGLTHCWLDEPLDDALAARFREQRTWMNPTLGALGSLTGEGRALQERYAEDARVQDRLGEEQRARVKRCMCMARKDVSWETAFGVVRRLKEEGLDIVAGSDSAGPALGTAYGLSLHYELSLLVNRCGFTPEEALASATSVTARCFRFSDRGRLAEGLRADLLLVEGNPLKDINATLDIRGVWREGRAHPKYEDDLYKNRVG